MVSCSRLKEQIHPYCQWCEDEEETVEHFLMECPHYGGLRIYMASNN
jgi:hypothetical protein